MLLKLLKVWFQEVIDYSDRSVEVIGVIGGRKLEPKVSGVVCRSIRRDVR